MICTCWPFSGQARPLLTICVAALLIVGRELVHTRGQVLSGEIINNQGKHEASSSQSTNNSTNVVADQRCHHHHHQVLKFVPQPDHYLSVDSEARKEKLSFKHQNESHRFVTSKTALEQSKVKSCCLDANLNEESRSRRRIGVTAAAVEEEAATTATINATKESKMMIKQHGSHYQRKPRIRLERISELRNLVRSEKSK